MRRLPSSTASRISAEFWVESRRISPTISRALLERNHRIHELLDCIGADSRAITGLDGSLSHLIADLSQNLQASRDTLFHLVQGLGCFMQAEHARKGGAQRGQHGVVGGEEADRLCVDALLGIRHLQ